MHPILSDYALSSNTWRTSLLTPYAEGFRNIGKALSRDIQAGVTPKVTLTISSSFIRRLKYLGRGFLLLIPLVSNIAFAILKRKALACKCGLNGGPNQLQKGKNGELSFVEGAGQAKLVTTCGHGIHLECAQALFKNHPDHAQPPTCPTCQRVEWIKPDQVAQVLVDVPAERQTKWKDVLATTKEEICSICYDDQAEDLIRLTKGVNGQFEVIAAQKNAVSQGNCGHVFHKKCIDKWTKNTCPNCRHVDFLGRTAIPLVAPAPRPAARQIPPRPAPGGARVRATPAPAPRQRPDIFDLFFRNNRSVFFGNEGY